MDFTVCTSRAQKLFVLHRRNLVRAGGAGRCSRDTTVNDQEQVDLQVETDRQSSVVVVCDLFTVMKIGIYPLSEIAGYDAQRTAVHVERAVILKLSE
eukprot:IDg3488t1